MKLDRRPAICSLAILLALACEPAVAYAQTPEAQPVVTNPVPGPVRCLAPGALASADLQAFLERPAVLLDIPGSIELMSRVRLLAASSGDAVKPVLDVALTATPAQMADMGAGLARAVNACSGPNPEMATLIQKQVAERAGKDPRYAPLLSAFAKALSGFATASLGPASRSAAPSASPIANNGAIGKTGPGSDNGLATAFATSPGVLRLSRIITVRSVSPTVPSGQ